MNPKAALRSAEEATFVNDEADLSAALLGLEALDADVGLDAELPAVVEVVVPKPPPVLVLFPPLPPVVLSVGSGVVAAGSFTGAAGSKPATVPLIPLMVNRAEYAVNLLGSQVNLTKL